MERFAAARQRDRPRSRPCNRRSRRAAQRSRDNREHLQQHAFDLLGNLERSLGNMGLTDIQESYVRDTVRAGADELLRHFDEARFIEKRLRRCAAPPA